MLLSEGQMSDYKGVALMLPVLPRARELLADKGYDADWFRQALAKRKIAACIPSKSNRNDRSNTTACSIASATRSRTCSAGSRTGGASTRVTTDAPILSCQQSTSPQSSSSGSINESDRSTVQKILRRSRHSLRLAFSPNRRRGKDGQ